MPDCDRICVACGERKLVLDFDGGKRRCRRCRLAQRREARANNYEAYRERERSAYDPEARAEKHQRAKKQDRAKLLIQQSRGRAKRLGVAFDLDAHADWLADQLKRGCEITGLPFDTMATEQRWNSPSIDRRTAGGDYTRDNVRLVLHAVNAALGNWGESVFEQVIKHWRTTHGSKAA